MNNKTNESGTKRSGILGYIYVEIFTHEKLFMEGLINVVEHKGLCENFIMQQLTTLEEAPKIAK